MLDDKLPRALDQTLQAAHPDGALRFAQASDLASGGAFGSAFLVLKGDRLAVLEDGDIVIDMAMTDVKEVRIVELLGGSSLVAAMRDGTERRLVRYTRTLVPEFGVFCRILNNIIEGLPVPLPEPEGAALCARCGNPLPERGANCPACVNFFAVFRRLLGLLSDYRARLGILIAATVVGVVAGVVPPILTKEITDGVILGGETGRLPGLIALMLVCGFVF
ncbi:MAG: hypothetical protein LBS30_07190, partial [Planctomycetota bacterium]|nr:hypothetical protein [Planctomycetota bacterium]